MRRHGHHPVHPHPEQMPPHPSAYPPVQPVQPVPHPQPVAPNLGPVVMPQQHPKPVPIPRQPMPPVPKSTTHVALGRPFYLKSHLNGLVLTVKHNTYS
ncbi:hypothetical protein KIPB_015933, partial [Kipferlia bialata]|eukprot:g15933.t1